MTIELPTHALTIRDPWAQAIVWGDKRVENRTRRPPEHLLGKRIAIHCGKTLDREASERFRSEAGEWADDGPLRTWWPRDTLHHPGCIIGDARLVGFFAPALNSVEVRGHVEPGCLWDRGSATEIADTIASDTWFTGPVGWLLDDVRAYAEPVEVRGQVYPFEIPEDVRAKLRVKEAA